MSTRREFLRTLGIGILAAPVLAKVVLAAKERPKPRGSWQLCGYASEDIKHIDEPLLFRSPDCYCSPDFARKLRSMTYHAQ